MLIKTANKRNVVADTIAAAYEFYAKQNRFIKTVELDKLRWGIFKAYMGRMIPDEIRDEVKFQDISVKKGSTMQVVPMRFYFEKSTLRPNEVLQIAEKTDE